MSTTIEKILNELQEVGKATALIVADSLGLEPGIAVAMLNNQVKQGNVKCVNGYFSITSQGEKYSPIAAPAKKVKASQNKTVACRVPVAENHAPAPAPAPASEVVEKPVHTALDEQTRIKKISPPQFIAEDDDFLTLNIPTPEYLTRQIRKHEANAKRLKKLRSTIRSLQRQNAQAVRHV